MKKSMLAVLTVFAITLTSCGSSTTETAAPTVTDSCAVKCDTACAEVSTVVATPTAVATETVSIITTVKE
jgi:hypothetical protein